MNNHNYALINQDATSFFEAERNNMINPFAKKWFEDMIDVINGNSKKNKGGRNEN